MTEITKLRRIMRQLRDPKTGCPWDREQTYQSIVPHTLEEAYEVADVIESGELDGLPGELGDLLFQVIFYCQIAEEERRFDFDDVVRTLIEKLTTRHPHVFGDEAESNRQAISSKWEARKAAERAARGKTSELDDVARALPALSRAQKVQKRASRVGFDWPTVSAAWAKIDEELGELNEQLQAGADEATLTDELGDVLFSVVNVARHLSLDAEHALRMATAKFESRFRQLEQTSEKPLAECNAETLDVLWQAVKRQEKKTGA